ncbi:hypothetical protein Tco_0383251 [Tanacetum coccineum]
MTSLQLVPRNVHLCLLQVAMDNGNHDDENPRRPVEIVKETYRNTNPENQKLIYDEAESVHIILNRIGNGIYSTVDACPNAKDIWIVIERLQREESIKIQDEVLHATDDNLGPTYDTESLEKIHTDDDCNVFSTKRHHSGQPETINDTYVVEKADINVIPASLDICDNEGKAYQNVGEPEDERELEKNKRALKDGKFELERYKTFQTNHQDKEKVELKCKETLALLADTKQQCDDSLKR